MEKGRFWEGIERYGTADEQIAMVEEPRKEGSLHAFTTVLREQAASLEPVPGKKSVSASAMDSKTPISDEIGHLRSKYITGKVAGKDLIDHRGREIIRKDRVITEDVIEAADREGKLAELIVNMKIPDFGDLR